MSFNMFIPSVVLSLTDPCVCRQGILMGQRMATMVMYLNDVEAGGETVFKREGKFGMKDRFLGIVSL
jgi:hypothetical protein